MPEPSPAPGPPALEVVALRYAAHELPAGQAAAFESLLATDQAARDALSEAVRLSAAALGQAPPAPDRSFRDLIRDRLRPLALWRHGWLGRRAYRGHPAAWVGLGLATAAAAALAATAVSVPPAGPDGAAAPRPEGGPTVGAAVTPERPRGPAGEGPPAPAPAGHPTAGHDPTLKEAEIWAELSTTEHVEKAHEDEARWRHLLRGLHPVHPGRPVMAIDSPMP